MSFGTNGPDVHGGHWCGWCGGDPLPDGQPCPTCEHDGEELIDGECPNPDCLEQYQYGEGP